MGVRWTVSGEGEVTLRWSESGGPRVMSDPVPSLGSALIQSFSTRELGGSCVLSYPPAGAVHTLRFPVRAGGGNC